MRTEIVADGMGLALRAADIICDAVRQRPDAVLGLPTGATPLAAYAELGRRIRRAEIDVSALSAFAIDEFVGAPASQGTNKAFFAAHLAPFADRIRMPDGESIGVFGDEIHGRGGFDLCVLGIGTNGHIAFNEPGSARDSRARVVELAEESRRAHADAFGSLDAVPRRGMTLGIADILESKAILVMAQGASKAAMVAEAIEGPQTADVPASWLQSHDNVTWLLDEAAASHLSSKMRAS